MRKLTIRLKGGPGSGHFGHKGRPGQEGGSLPSDSSASAVGIDYSDDPNNFVSRFPQVREDFESASDPKELSKIKARYVKESDAGSTLPDGVWIYFHKKVSSHLKQLDSYQPMSPKDARTERILHITNSEGKRTSRKW